GGGGGGGGARRGGGGGGGDPAGDGPGKLRVFSTEPQTGQEAVSVTGGWAPLGTSHWWPFGQLKSTGITTSHGPALPADVDYPTPGERGQEGCPAARARAGPPSP